MTKFRSNTVELVKEHQNVSLRLLKKCFGEAYKRKISQLSEYDNYEGRINWNESFNSLRDSVSTLKLEMEKELEGEWANADDIFYRIDFTLDKINELKTKSNDIQSKELYLYIDYFELKMIEILWVRERERIIF